MSRTLTSPGRRDAADEPPQPGEQRPWPFRRRQQRWRPETNGRLLVLPILLFLIVLFVLPILAALAVSFLGYDPQTFISDELTLDSYRRFLGDEFYRSSIALTFWLAALSTLICIVLGYPIAYHLHSLRSRVARATFALIVFLPLMLSLVITSFAWLVILGRGGLVNQALMLLPFINEPIRVHGRPSGVVIVMAYQYIPYYVLNVFAALENIDHSIVRAARSLGARQSQAFFRVTLPLSLPGVVSGMLLVFALAIGSFVTPLIIGAGQVKTVPVFVYNFAIFIFDWPGAAALGGLLLILSLGATYAMGVIAQRWFMAWLKVR